MTVSRRELLAGSAAASGAAVVAACSHGPERLVRHHRTPVPPSPPVSYSKFMVGTGTTYANRVQALVPGARAVRNYHDAVNDIPLEWPVWLFPDGTTGPVVLSIRPMPEDLLSGRLDKQILSMVRSAPPFSYLSAWHEAGNLPAYKHLNYLYPSGMQRVHAKMMALCHGTNVRYGAIMCMPPPHMPKWLIPQLDWYGLDIYDWPQFHFNDSYAYPIDFNGRLKGRLDSWGEVMSKVSGQAHPNLVVAETNGFNPDTRPEWVQFVGHWLKGHGGTRLIVFWTQFPDSAHGGWPWTGPYGHVANVPAQVDLVRTLRRLSR